MKKKKIFIIITVIFLLIAFSPIGIYLGIVAMNNGIARHVEKELKTHSLPQATTLLDSVSVADKLVGNGNGMQYMGSILVVSDLSQEDLYAYYSQSFDYVEVRKQASPAIDFIHPDGYSFELFGDPNHHDHYSVTCWGSPKDVGMGEFMTMVLLNMDLRGH